MGFYVCCPDSPDKARRFVRTFNGLGSVSFGNKASVSISEKGAYVGNRLIETCKAIVDVMREGASSGRAPAWYKSARVEDYNGVVQYPSPQNAAAKAKAEFVDDPPDFMQASDKTWRRVPIAKFQKTFRGYKLPYAFIDSAGIPRAGEIERGSKSELVQILFDTTFPIFTELTLTFEEVPPPPPEQPVKEKVFTAEELAAVPMMSEAVYNKLSGDKATYLYHTDPVFKAGVDKMWAHQEKIQAAFDRKQAEEDRQKAIAELKKKHEGLGQ